MQRHTTHDHVRRMALISAAMAIVGLLFASMVFAVLLAGTLPADARQLTKVEAELATVGTWGAVVNDTTASGGKAVRWNKPATTGTLNFTISEPADSVSVYIKAGTNSSSRVCVRPMVDNVALGTQPLCVARTQRTYVGKTFAANLAAGDHTLALTGSDISGTDRLFADYTSFDTSASSPPPPPDDPYANPNSTNFQAPADWNPAAGSVHLHPIMECSTLAAPGGSGAGTGANLNNANVTLINPEVRGCDYGIFLRGANAKVLFDPNKVGYGTAANPMVRNNRFGFIVEGSAGYEIKAINGGEGFIRDTYRPVIVRAGYNGVISDLDIAHPASLNWGGGHGLRSVVGIKFACNYTQLAPADRSCRNTSVVSNDVMDFDEEGISLDPGGAAGVDAAMQGEGNTSAVFAADDTVTLAGTWNGLDNTYVGAYVVFNTGPIVGKYMRIMAIDSAAQRLTVVMPDGSDASSTLASANQVQEVSIGAPYHHVEFLDNIVDATGSRVGLSFGGFALNCEMRNNVISGTQTYIYGPEMNVRDAPQSLRHTSIGEAKGGPLTGPGQMGLSAYNSVTDNSGSHDISFNVRHGTPYTGIPTYQANNTSSGGHEVYTDGSYLFLASDPNP